MTWHTSNRIKFNKSFQMFVSALVNRHISQVFLWNQFNWNLKLALELECGSLLLYIQACLRKIQTLCLMSEESFDMKQKKKLRDYFTATNIIILWFHFDSLKFFLRHKYLNIYKIIIYIYIIYKLSVMIFMIT